MTPLHVTALGNSKTVELLIEKGASVNALTMDDVTALHYAAQSGYSETVAILIENGASLNARTKYVATPLHLAASLEIPKQSNY
jgi:ankyrin repeat protein